MEKLSLSKQLQIIAEKELNEVPNRVQNDIDHIRVWLSKQPHIIPRTDNYTLLLFLRSCKFSLEKTKKRIELFYTIRTGFPEIFKNRNPFYSGYQYCLKQNMLSVTAVARDGPLLILVRTENSNPNLVSIYEIITLGAMILDVVLREYINTSVIGAVLIVDCKYLPIKYLPQCTPTLIKKMITCYANAYPVRVKEIRLINVASYWVSIFNTFKIFLPEKIQGRIFCHNLDEGSAVLNCYPASALPIEYGGSAGSFSDLCAEITSKIENYSDWFLEDGQFGCTEKKRTEESKRNIDLFSLNGSFRQLEVD